MSNAMLSEMASKKELKEIYVDFNKEQLDDLKDELLAKMTTISRTEMEYEAIKADYKGKLKALKGDQAVIFKQLLEGRTTSEEVLLYVPNFEEGIMDIYRESTGELYESRKLRPDERQMTFNLNVAN